MKSDLQKVRFVHRAVNDLAWLLSQPPLFTHIDNIPSEWLLRDYIIDELYPWLYSIDQNPSVLLAHLKLQRSTRLGIYVEQLLSFYFEQHPRFSLLAKNLQVNNPMRTIGEFDFIIYDHKDGQHKHIEVAIKFYLGRLSDWAYIPNNRPLYNWHKWVGPNHKDTLGLKMSHLLQHQLRLSEQPEGKNSLKAFINQGKTITSRLFFAGQFYFPVFKSISAPSFSNTINQKNRWYESNFIFNNNDSLSNDSHYCFLPRQYWLSAISQSDIDKGLILYSRQEMLEVLQNQVLTDVNEWHIAKIQYKNNEIVEKERLFILNTYHLPFDAKYQNH